MRLSFLAASLLVFTQLVACGDGPLRPTLRIDARRVGDRAPVPGLVFALDHAGGRVEGVTDANGVAVVAAPDWSAGSVDLTYGGDASRTLVSLLGIPRTETLTVEVETPHVRKVHGSFLNRLSQNSQLRLAAADIGSSLYGSFGSMGYDLELDSTAATRLIGVEADASGGWPRFLKWFSVPVAAGTPGSDTNVDIDIAAAQSVPSKKLTTTVDLPNAEMWFVQTNTGGGPAWLGAAVSGMRLSNGPRYQWEAEVAEPEGVTPMTMFLGSSDRSTFSMKTLVGLPRETETLTDLLPPPQLASTTFDATRTTVQLTAVPDGVDRTGAIIAGRSAGEWRVEALDHRAALTVPAPPMGISDPRRSPGGAFGQAFFCAGYMAPTLCSRFAMSSGFGLTN